jgi:phage baseplate assembly protein W
MAKNLTISYPINNSPSGYLFDTEQVTSRAVQANLLLLLTTEVGTRWYMPDYGCDLRPVLFEFNGDEINKTIRNIIESAVNKFMPEITILKVNFYTYNNEPNTKYVDVDYTFKEGTYENTSTLSLKYENT